MTAAAKTPAAANSSVPDMSGQTSECSTGRASGKKHGFVSAPFEIIKKELEVNCEHEKHSYGQKELQDPKCPLEQAGFGVEIEARQTV